MHSLTEKWGLQTIIMSLGDIAKILSEDAESADLTPNERGLIIGACASVANLSDQMHAEWTFYNKLMSDEEKANWVKLKSTWKKSGVPITFSTSVLIIASDKPVT